MEIKIDNYTLNNKNRLLYTLYIVQGLSYLYIKFSIYFVSIYIKILNFVNIRITTNRC